MRMQPEKSKKGLTIFLHIAAWILLGFIVLFYPPLSWSFDVPSSFWLKQLINLFILVGAFYLNARVITPRLLLNGKIALFAAWSVTWVVLILVLARIIEVQLQVNEAFAVSAPGKNHKSVFSLDVYLFMVILLVLMISTSLAVIERWQADSRKKELIEKQHISSELSLLKAQINPHFFFNTLNNIYALTYSDVPVSREAILKLSRMMRYVLYETIQDTAFLSKEISFIKDYIELMKLRLHGCTTVSFTEPQPDYEYEVAPMLLLPFIENAFKHGRSGMEKAEIRIDLGVENGILLLTVVNDIHQDKDVLTTESGGIGLINTQRRLNLLYPGKHSLVVDEDRAANTYSVVLEIDLDKSRRNALEHGAPTIKNTNA